MFFNTLYARLSFGLALLLVSIGLLYLFISDTVTRHYVQQINQEVNHDLARNLVADRNLVAEGRLDQQALEETFRIYMVINPSIEIYLLDLEGHILSYSADPGKVKRRRVAMAPIKAFLGMEQPYPLLGDDPRSHDRRKAFSVTPVPSAEQPQGYLYVVLRGEEYDAVEQMVRESLFLRMSGWAVAVSLGIGLLAGLLLFHLLTRRLQRLSSLMGTFESSGFRSKPEYLGAMDSSDDEIDRLGITFDRMAQRIHEQIRQLQEQDTLRRQLVAQVSHDLRTPLASMIGYLESLQMKSSSVSESQQQDFIATALRQGRRLSHLISELFVLASLEARETQADTEPFVVTELVSDVLQKHHPRALRQDVTLETSALASVCFALGDISMTERVLDNLIDNALRYTPRGGKILITQRVMDSWLEISVSDTGSGIPPSALSHLFEPFSRRTSEAVSDGHSGLGLAIAKRMMELQQGEIEVKGGLGRGTVFTFRLPRAG